MNWMRRKFLQSSTALSAGMLFNRAPQHQHDRHEQHNQPAERTPGDMVPVQTPDLPKLPFTTDNGVKVFHLIAEVVECEFLPASHMGPARKVFAWGYNGSVPGPMIEAVEGDRVRIILHNKLPEPTTIHWHGLEVPAAMDGTPYISQPMIEPGSSFTYEFDLNQNGTFFYHSHGAMQEMMGMIGLFIIHPKTPQTPRVDRDFGLILQEWAILPNNPIPNTMAMEFNWLTINGKAAPATTPLIVKQGERVRLRLVNLGMDHHPMHLHGHQFVITGTEGGRIPESAWYPGNTVLVGVAQARDIEFVAKYAGDWMVHCHLPHHMMNQMVSMAGPLAQAGRGAQTGMGMNEGMGMLRQGHALSDDFGPGFGRGMGITSRETATSNLVSQEQGEDSQGEVLYTCVMHPEIRSPQPGNCPKCGMVLVPKRGAGKKQRVPGFPQDMMMPMDEAVAKPETWGLPPGWTASLMGMMTLVRVFPEEKYNEIIKRVREGQVEKPQSQPAHKH